MKCLTLTQPWATLVAIGAKRIETRSFHRSYRGALAIHAASGLGPVGGKKGFRELCGTEPFCSVLNAAMKAWDTPPKSLREMAECPFMPFGAIVAVCFLDKILPIEMPVNGRSWTTLEHRINPEELTEQERAFGDYTSGRFAWLLVDIRPLPEPVPCSGALGLWEPDTLTAMAVTRQLS